MLSSWEEAKAVEPVEGGLFQDSANHHLMKLSLVERFLGSEDSLNSTLTPFRVICNIC